MPLAKPSRAAPDCVRHAKLQGYRLEPLSAGAVLHMRMTAAVGRTVALRTPSVTRRRLSSSHS
jgi:hypothetical protein